MLAEIPPIYQVTKVLTSYTVHQSLLVHSTFDFSIVSVSTRYRSVLLRLDKNDSVSHMILRPDVF
jgi:hypothetical protein